MFCLENAKLKKEKTKKYTRLVALYAKGLFSFASKSDPNGYPFLPLLYFFSTQGISDSQLASLFFGAPLRLGGGRDAAGERGSHGWKEKPGIKFTSGFLPP